MLGEDSVQKIEGNNNLQKTSLNLNSIDLNPKQPRKIFDGEKLAELSNSIKNLGQLVPIIVKENPLKKGRFIVVAGERRLRASKIAGMKFIDVIIKSENDEYSSLASVIENVQREDLTSLEEAEAYRSLISEYNLTHEEISKYTGKSRSHISNFIRIVGLPEEVKKLLSAKKISFGHARALLAASNIKQLAKIVVSKELNVRQTEDLVKNEQNIGKSQLNKEGNIKEKDPNISDYEKYLSLKLGFEVQIKDKNGKGNISVKYQSLDQLEEIISLFNEKNN